MRRLIPAAVVVCLSVAGLAAGESMAAADTTCVLGVSVCAAGQNDSGQLGDGTTTNTSQFVPVAGSLATPLRSVATGYNHSLAVAADGSVWAWGNNQEGEVGDGTTTNRNTPVQVAGLGSNADVVAVAASVQTFSSLALKADGTVLAWGYNGQGDLGTGDYSNRLTPTVVSGLGSGSGVVAIAAGTESLALKADGTVLTWGGNDRVSTPRLVLGLGPNPKVTAISSFGFSMALKADGSAWAWGLNANGQLGDGTTNASPEQPVQVSGLGPGAGVVAVAAGELHGMALRSDGQVMAWGYGADGALGTGDGASSLLPVQVKGLGAGSSVIRIAAGGGDSFAVTSTGSLMGWGNNVLGEIGNGTTGYAYEPANISTITSPATAAIATGYYHTLIAPLTAISVPPPSLQLDTYVALGDSYSSGEGAPNPDYLAGTDVRNNRCHRSTAAYPEILNAAIKTTFPNFTFRACSGAVLQDFTVRNRDNADEPAQISWLDKHTGLVTLTAGGNNVSFAEVMTYCALRGAKQPLCEKKWATTVDAAIAAISAPTTTGNKTLAAIYRQIRSNAPDAKVVVVGYPRLFPVSPPNVCDTGALGHNFVRSDMLWLNAEAKKLDEAIKAAATNAGFVFVDAYDAFNGHEVCTGDPYLNKAIVSLRASIKSWSFHPNRQGQSVLASLIEPDLM